MDEWQLRAATAEDLPALADLYLRVRAAAIPAMPPGIHTDDEVRGWVGGWNLEDWDVWLAEAPSGEPLGYAVVAADWLHSLYVAPETAGRGVGGALLDLVKSLRPNGFCLWVFVSNTPARTFYDHRGLVELERTDGSTNEEKSPDLKLAWPGADPVAFFRDLIDDVDAQLGDLLARRVALTRVVQAHKPDPTRDLDRERAIARAMAKHAPELGEERLGRIVEVIIEESLDAAGER